MVVDKTKKIIKMYKDKFFISKEKIAFLYNKYSKDFNASYKKSSFKHPDEYIESVLDFLLSNDFDPNFIRAVFGQPSKIEPIMKQEIQQFKTIFLTKMLKK